MSGWISPTGNAPGLTLNVWTDTIRLKKALSAFMRLTACSIYAMLTSAKKSRCRTDQIALDDASLCEANYYANSSLPSTSTSDSCSLFSPFPASSTVFPT